MPTAPKTPPLVHADASATQRSGRKNRRRHAAAAVSRKRNAKLPLEWSEEETAEARYPSSNRNSSSSRSNCDYSLATIANVLHVRALQEIFPSLERVVVQDVLVAARCEVDVAAAMLGELVREQPAEEAPVEAEIECALADAMTEEQPADKGEQLEVQPDQQVLDIDDELDEDDDWSKVTAAHHEDELGAVPTSQTLHDGWEIVESAKPGVW